MSNFIMGCLIGVVAMLIVVDLAEGTARIRVYNKMITECELPLLRSQKCDMIAVQTSAAVHSYRRKC